MRRRAPASGRLSSPTSVGRAGEEELLLQAVASPPALVLVDGEAGVGKTRLVREALASPELRELRVLIGHCHRLREPFFLGPVIEALRGLAEQPTVCPLSPLVGALQPLVPELSDTLPPQLPPAGDRRSERHRVFRAIRELVEAAGPTVCVLEDLQWTDEGTLELLEFLLTQPPSGLALVLTYRGESLFPSSRLIGLASRLPAEIIQASIKVRPLPVEQVQRLTGAILESDGVTEDLATRLHERTGGIPFVLEEDLRLLRDRGQVTLVDGVPVINDRAQADVPAAVRQSVHERMEPFGGDARRLIRSAAVLGAPADESLLAAVAGLAPARVVKALTEALSSSLLGAPTEGCYGFQGALAARAVYDDIPAPERRRLHQRAGQALSGGSGPEARVAHHFKLADRPRRWAHYAEAAADAAGSVGDHRAAACLLEQALSVPGLSRAARVRLAIKLGWSAPHGDRLRSIDLLQGILDGEPMAVGVRGELRFLLARLRYYAGDEGPWHAEMVEAVGECRRRPRPAARAMLQLAWPTLRAGDFEEDLLWLERAVQAADEADDPATAAAVYAQRAAILLCVGDPAGWSALDEIPVEGETVEERLELLHGYHSLLWSLGFLGQPRRAQAFLSQVARLAEGFGHVGADAWLDSATAALDWCAGRWEGLAPRARQLAESGSAPAALAADGELVLGSLLLARGQTGEAEAHFESVLEESGRGGWLLARVTASALLARIRLLQGDATSARQVAAVGLEVVRRKRIWVWGKDVVPSAVQAYLACGQQAEAHDLAERFAARVSERVGPAALAASHLCRGAVAEAAGSHGAAALHFETAETAWSELPCPYEAARAREARARCLLAVGDDDGVQALLGALEAFDELHAGPDAARARAELTRRGVAASSPSRGGRRAYGNELSPREAEVVRLAGSGHKNREIAESLVISPRTVEAHVASAIRKLGVESRQALVRVVVAELDGDTT